MEYFLNKICKIIKRKGDFLKKIIKIIGIILILLLIIISIIFIENDIKKENISYAASSYGTSDIQLMARAINGEARGEPYEGQVAVRSRHPKPSEKFTISQYHSRSHL